MRERKTVVTQHTYKPKEEKETKAKEKKH